MAGGEGKKEGGALRGYKSEGVAEFRVGVDGAGRPVRRAELSDLRELPIDEVGSCEVGTGPALVDGREAR
jgi:hypothetical protein